MKKLVIVALLFLSGCSIRAVASVETGNAVKGKSVISKELKDDDGSNFDSGVGTGVGNALDGLLSSGQGTSSSAPAAPVPGLAQ